MLELAQTIINEAIIPESIWLKYENEILYIYDIDSMVMLTGDYGMYILLMAVSQKQSIESLLSLLTAEFSNEEELSTSVMKSLYLFLRAGVIVRPGSEQDKGLFLSGMKKVSFDSFIGKISNQVRFENSQPLKRPIMLEWELTNRCNLQCFYCYYGDNKKRTSRELSTTEALNVVDNIADAGIFQVTIEGGEPYLRDDLEQIVSRMKTRRMQVRILTNGTKLTRERAHEAARILDPRMDSVQISLDGSSEETHSLSRGAGSFTKTIKALEYLSEVNIPTAVSMVVHDGNMMDITNTFLLISRLPNVLKFTISHYMKTGDALFLQDLNKERLLQEYFVLKEKAEEICSRMQISPLFGHLLHYPQYAAMFTENIDGPEIFYCRGARAKATIDANGDLYPCHCLMYEPFKMGNVKECSLSEIWNLQHNQALRQQRDVEKADCFRCAHRKICGKKCMGVAYEYYGDINRADPNCMFSCQSKL